MGEGKSATATTMMVKKKTKKKRSVSRGERRKRVRVSEKSRKLTLVSLGFLVGFSSEVICSALQILHRRALSGV